MIKNEIPQPLSSDKLLVPEFISKLQQDGYFVDDLLMEIEEKTALAALGLNSDQPGLNRMIGRQTAIRVVRQWTGFPNDEIKSGLYNPEREEQLPLVQQAVASLSSAWLKNDLTPPDIRVKQVTRRTGLAPERIIKLVDKFQPEIKNGAGKYLLAIANFDVLKPVINGNYSSTLIGTDGLALSPKRVIKEARYQSRLPGGGPVQRARLQNKNIPGAVRAMAVENARIKFVSPQSLKPQPPELLKSLLGREDFSVISTIEWFKKQRRRKWLRGGNEQLLASDLMAFSQGQPTEFLIWNCLEFKWQQAPAGEKPPCTIKNSLDTSIVLYFQSKIEEVIRRLSLLGDFKVAVLVPSSEATFEDTWAYTQPRQERETVINKAVDDLNNRLQSFSVPDNASITAVRWDEYLLDKGIQKLPDEYSREGEQKIRRLPGFLDLQSKAVENEVAYFSQFGIRVAGETVKNNGIRYYGTYAGEGQAMTDLRKIGTNVILLNFEEFRVAEMTALGADNGACIITPVNHKSMGTYYKFQNHGGRLS